MGELPGEYLHIQAAKYLGVTPMQLMKESIWWRDKALKYMTAEVQAQEIMKQNQQNRQ